jgi:hypothetical protein
MAIAEKPRRSNAKNKNFFISGPPIVWSYVMQSQKFSLRKTQSQTRTQ